MAYIKIVNNSRNYLPEYAKPGDAGMDLRAHIDEAIILPAGGRVLIPTGLSVALPLGWEFQVRPRSGLAYQYGITVLNSPGTIDANYRGDIGIILFNSSYNDFIIEPGDRIAQMVLAKVEEVEWNEVDFLDETERGITGFGQSGIK